MIGRLRNTDVMALANVAIFIAMCELAYYRQFLQHWGAGNDLEFLVYAAAILAAIGFGWLFLRLVRFPNWILALMQLGILAHFAGGLVTVGGVRLYDIDVLGLPFDKYVHALNSFAGAAVAARLIDPPRDHPHMREVLILLVVLGGGAGVEIIEYMAKNSMSGTGVGDYDNNMQDLVANLVGGLLYLAAAAAARIRHGVAARA
jgi:uncharacterized membrane protein YjdF